VWSLLISIAMIAAHDYIGRLFSDDPAVISLAGQVWLHHCMVCVVAHVLQYTKVLSFLSAYLHLRGRICCAGELYDGS
jgi:Na+-driven multidrug efflux pump